MEQNLIEIDDHDIITYYIDLNSLPLIILKGHKGYIMNEFLDIKTANNLNDIAGKISNVKTINEALRTTVIQTSNKAMKKGLIPGMKVRDFLIKLF
jgi:uncharacterized protein YunC (DUF1805 family)